MGMNEYFVHSFIYVLYILFIFLFLIYIFSDVPTKMDNDVLTALHEVQVDAEKYPYVHKWYTAMENHTLEERNK